MSASPGRSASRLGPISVVSRLASVALLAVGAAGCGDQGGGPILGLEPPAFGIQLSMGPFQVPSDSEVTVCRYLTLPGNQSVDVRAFASRMRPGSHHFILYRSLLPVAPSQGPCLMDLPRAVTFGAQTIESEQSLPPGVSLQLPAGVTLIMESHYINPADTPTTGQVVVNLEYLRPSQVETRADVLFFINQNIEIPPMSTAETEKTCPLPANTNIFALSSHTHRRGTAFTMDLVEMSTGAVLQRLYENYNWEDPLIVRYPDDSPLSVGPDRGLRFRCSYLNDSDVTVRWGLSAEDEMCIAFGLYYPTQGIKYCF
jgi:hypothetical protein